MVRILDIDHDIKAITAETFVHSYQFPNLKILFYFHHRQSADSNVSGILRFEGIDYQLTVLNLPTIAECYKTYDDVNLVKTGDIGQVLVVGPCTEEECRIGEIRDGVTHPMRNARERVFRKPIDVPKEKVAQVESQILDILNVSLKISFSPFVFLSLNFFLLKSLDSLLFLVCREVLRKDINL